MAVLVVSTCNKSNSNLLTDLNYNKIIPIIKRIEYIRTYVATFKIMHVSDFYKVYIQYILIVERDCRELLEKWWNEYYSNKDTNNKKMKETLEAAI